MKSLSRLIGRRSCTTGSSFSGTRINPSGLIVLEKAAFGYSGTAVLTNVDLAIRAEDFIAILGPNGAGKTTLFRGLLGLLAPLQGHVVRDPLLNSRIGYVPQRDALDPLYPVSSRDVVRMGIVGYLPWYRFAGNAYNTLIDAALAQVGLHSRADSPFFELSGGQRQRVLIARALVMNPKLLVLDEPTAGVDPEAETQILNLLTELNRRDGLPIVMVTHHIQQIQKHAKKILTVKDGSIQEGMTE